MIGAEGKGFDLVKSKLEGAKTSVHKHSAFAIGMSARALLVAAQGNAPVQTGRLRDSGRIFPPRTQGERAESGVIFDVNYSGRVHERLGRGRKFLQKAIGTEAHEMLTLYTLGLKLGDMFSKGQRKAGVKKLATAKRKGVTKNNIKTLGMGQSGGARAGAGRPRRRSG